MDTIRDLSEAQQNSTDAVTGTVGGFFRKFGIGTILNRCGIKKAKGVSPMTIVTSVFSLAFTGKNFFRGIVRNESEPFCKDAAYELLRRPTHNWRRVLLLLAAKIVSFVSSLT